MTGAGALAGRRILVVEDEYLLADDMAKGLRASGAEVVGPVGGVDDALDLIAAGAALDGAVLDINLRGEMAFPVADALLERGVPFVFATGYDDAVIPVRYGAIARCEKPVNTADVVGTLLG